MKKLYLLAAVAAMTVAANAATEGRWTYTTDGYSATVTKYTPPVDLLAWAQAHPVGAWPKMFADTIPATLGGKPVVAIGDGAFENVIGLMALDMPTSIYKIGARAFYNCIPLGGRLDLRQVMEIGDSAFCNTSDPEFYFQAQPGAIRIGKGAFLTTNNPNGLDKEAVMALFSAFWGGDDPFEPEDPDETDEVSPIGSIMVPFFMLDAYKMNLAANEDAPFYYHAQEESIYGVEYAAGNVVYKADGIWEGQPGQWSLVNGYWATGEVTIPDEIYNAPVNEIVNDAFLKINAGTAALLGIDNISNTNLTGINLGENISIIFDQAFYGCTGLKKLDLKNTFEVGQFAFANCNNIEEIHLRKSASDCYLNQLCFANIDLGAYWMYLMSQYMPVPQPSAPDMTHVIPAVVYVPQGELQNYIDYYAYEAESEFEPAGPLYYFYKAGRLLEEGDTPQPGTRGDLTGDNTVDVDDLNLVINMMLHKANETAAADLNHDGSVDVDDLNTIINIMLRRE
ncbi:MAG: leucine-rich repeat protein [Muribaculaceae bacterium]|nr:leucine-rich repeat protein [Muribaculaceae bacterium]